METFESLRLTEASIEGIVYHSGDFSRRADPLGAMVGRSTGYFGTGYYFCTKPEKVENLGDDRPIYSFTVDGLNLLIGDIKTHEALKTIQKYVSTKPWLDSTPDEQDWWKMTYYYGKLFEEWDSHNKLGKNLRYVMENEYYNPDTNDYAVFDTWKEAYNEMMEDDFHFPRLMELIFKTKELKEIAEEIRKDHPDFDLIDELDDGTFFNVKEYDYSQRIRRDFNFAHYYFSASEETIDTAVDEIVEELRPYYVKGILQAWHSDIANTDSIPTRFLRKLGFDGVYPTPECDNTSYGGCIFDKENIRNLKQIR